MPFFNKYYLLIFLSFVSITITAQDQYFNKRYSYCQKGDWFTATGAIEDENGYFICGMTVDTLTDRWYRIGVMKIDKNGERRWSKDYGKNEMDFYTGWSGYLQEAPTDGYYLAGSKNYFYPTNFDVGYLMRFDNNWDTVWTKEYNSNKTLPNDSSLVINNMAICSNGDLIMIGGFYISGNTEKIWLIRTDSLGNQIWQKEFGSNAHYQGYSVVQTLDNGFAIGGLKYGPTAQQEGEPIVIKTDTFGNQEWIEYLGGPFRDWVAMVCLSHDSNILVGTNYSHDEIGNDPHSTINLYKLDYQGTTLWNKQYGDILIWNKLNSIRVLEDGSILSAGYGNPLGMMDITAWILKTSANGDSLWLRNYRLLQGENSRNRLTDVIDVSKSGLLAVGSVWPSNPDTGTKDAWVLKLDSLGCEYPFCDTTVGIAKVEFNGSDGFSVYPNPAGEILTFEFQETGARSTGQGARIAVFDYFGRKVEEIVVPPWQETIQMDVSSWNAGVYVAVLWGENGIVGREKFVVARGIDKR